jgi:glycine/D-amino acid oxidase-like deaminating enzyme
MTPVKIETFQGKGKGPKVAVLGCGVAGMSAAHELVERGFRVVVFERQPELSGGHVTGRAVALREAADRVALPIPPDRGRFRTHHG